MPTTWHQGCSPLNIDKLIKSDEARKQISTQIDACIQYFETHCRYEFRGLDLVIITNHTDKVYRAVLIDLEYVYELEEGKTDQQVIKGLKSIKKIVDELDLDE